MSGPPKLSQELLELVARTHPLPMADAVAALAAADSLYERRDRVVECFRACLRYLGCVVLAARSQYGPGPLDEKAQLKQLMRTLRQRGLTDGQWVGLIRGLLGSWSRAVEAHAVPAMARLFSGKEKKGKPYFITALSWEGFSTGRICQKLKG